MRLGAHDPDGQKQIFFVILASVRLQHGRRSAEQNFTVCDVKEEATGPAFLEGLELQLTRGPFVEHHTGLQHPLRSQAHGAIAVSVEEDLIEMMIASAQRPGSADAGEVLPMATTQRAKHVDMSAGQYCVLGTDDTHERVVIKPSDTWAEPEDGDGDGGDVLPGRAHLDSESSDSGDGPPGGRDMMDVFDVAAAVGRPTLAAPVAAYQEDELDEFTGTVARAMGSDPPDLDDEELHAIFGMLGVGRGDAGNAILADEPDGAADESSSRKSRREW